MLLTESVWMSELRLRSYRKRKLLEESKWCIPAETAPPSAAAEQNHFNMYSVRGPLAKTKTLLMTDLIMWSLCALSTESLVHLTDKIALEKDRN